MSRLKRLLVFVEHFPPFLGSDRSIYELAMRAARKGISVHFAATQPLRYLLGERPKNWPYVRNWTNPPKVAEPNVTFEYILSNSHLQAMWKRFPPIAFLLTILIFSYRGLRSAMRFNPDVVISVHATPIVGSVSLLASKLLLKPLVMGCPDWMSAYAAELAGKRVTSLGPAFLHIMELVFYSLATKIFTVTAFLKRLLILHGTNPNKIEVIPNGVDSRLFHPTVDTSRIVRRYRLENRVVILFSGHLERWAGISSILFLARKLHNEFPDGVILLVGTGEESQELYSTLIEENLGHLVVHAGYHPFEEMPEFCAAAHIALCIFPDTPVAHAASPLKLFEYMAAGNAVVATKVAGTAEVLDSSTGILVSPDNLDELSNGVLTLCNNPELRERLGHAARALAEANYSWDVLSQQLIDLCEAAIAHR